MDFKSTVIFAILASGALGNTSHLCDDIAHLDCQTYVQGDTDEEVCDNRNVLYNNFCEYSKAKCADDSISVASLGQCYGNRPVEIYTTKEPSITTPSPTAPSVTTPTPAPTLDPLLSIFCQNKDTISCAADIDPVCASNGRLYINKCDFTLALCDDTSLTLQDTHNCHH
ncbi:uncharacterized protein LOC110462401 [Mizuhopecten yessoensis]|uniref:Kazal-like domain-containing protein n=1 Tax=Mizuhopecten yessoensis TaxID=6573 RepID=A0A210PY88_MIZYE|nr:uncharacterized protein LOC110462401 [Mizuhopecten yessoensis]OWF41442.1 hypothetical protein KP79_PYT21889 [Mizuhopecten yessoensis]